MLWHCRGRVIEIGRRPLVMGIVNVTPLVKRHPPTSAATAPLLNNSMYSSAGFSEEGWYITSLMITSPFATAESTKRADRECLSCIFGGR